MNEALRDARARLERVTPLKTDCGRVCGAACCRSAEGEETGMLLFPGEEALFAGRPGWVLRPAALGTLAVCPGVCDREMRPLACRLFPLLPVLREDGVRIAVDARARGVCPLARGGLNAFSPEFREAVRAAGVRLAEDEEQAAFLRLLTAQQDEWTCLRRQFGGGKDV